MRLVRDALINYFGYVCAGLSGVILVPVLVGSLSRELYGVWIAGLALQYSVSFLNAGLGRSIAREVAADRKAAAPFVIMASNLYLALGLLGFLAIAGLGRPLSHGLHVSPQNLGIVRGVFALMGIAFLGEQIQSAGVEILTGLRKFTAINALMTSSIVVRTIGMIVVAKKTSSLPAIASWHAFTCVVTGAVALALAIHEYPGFRPRFVKFQWRMIRPQLEYSVFSQIAAGCSNLLWRSASLIIGFKLGPAAIVPYEIGQKLPMYVNSLNWQAAEALLPAASEYHSSQRDAHTSQLIQIGTRGLLFLALPFAIVLFVMAPQLISLWTGAEFSGSSLILRVIVLAVLADTAAAACIQTLWARGNVALVVRLGVLSLAIVAVTIWPLLTWFGAAGAAIALAAAVCITAPLYGLAAAHSGKCRLCQLWWPAVRDLWAPALASTACVVATARLIHRVSWTSLFSIASLGFIAYLVSFYFFGAQQEEKRLLHKTLDTTGNVLRFGYRSLRHELGRIPLLRRIYFSGIDLRECVLDSTVRDRKHLATFYGQEDPFGFTRELEQFRFQRAMEMLHELPDGDHFGRALEVGCAEGMFTERLAPQCDSLLAVDLLDIALDRARYRCRNFKNVDFAIWDSRSGTLDSTFDLIVATGVLEYIHRPSTLKQACNTLVLALRPGGYLLAGNTVADNNIEQTWLGKRLIRGTLINDYLQRDPRLETVSTSLDQCVCPFAHVLLRRRAR